MPGLLQLFPLGRQEPHTYRSKYRSDECFYRETIPSSLLRLSTLMAFSFLFEGAVRDRIQRVWWYIASSAK